MNRAIYPKVAKQSYRAQVATLCRAEQKATLQLNKEAVCMLNTLVTGWCSVLDGETVIKAQHQSKVQAPNK